MAYWSYSCGRKGVSRVRVYERSVSPSIYVEWMWQGQRRQRSLKSTTGHPVTDRRLAMQIAHEMSRNLERDHNRAARAAIFGQPGKDHTLAELLEKMHRIRGKMWSQQHARDQETKRRYWLDKLGNDTPLSAVTEGIVEAVTSDTAEDRDWSARSLQRHRLYIQEAYKFACEKLKWIEPRQMLTALDIPKANSTSKPYTLAEVRKLLPALESVDVRAGWMGHVAWQSGRRKKALRTFPATGADVRDGHTVLTFPGATDKVRKTGQVVVVGRAHELTAQLVETAGEHLLGDPPPTHEKADEWLWEAEKIAGITHQTGRAWYGIKRRYAGESHGMVGRDKQAGVTEPRLAEIYRPDDLDPKRAVAEALNEMLDADPVPDTD